MGEALNLLQDENARLSRAAVLEHKQNHTKVEDLIFF